MIVDLTPAETELFAKLGSRGDLLNIGLSFALGPGEAACVAIASERGLVLATDDNDALKAYRTLRPKGRYERIRKLLQRAPNTNFGQSDRAKRNSPINARCRILGQRKAVSVALS